MTDVPIPCSVCGQDWIRPYRSLIDGRRFLLCPECDSVWLPGEDISVWARHSLGDLFADVPLLPGEVDWDYIEPAEPETD